MRHQREIVDYNVIIFYDCHVGVARCTCTRVTLVAWLITGLRAFENAAMPFRIRLVFGSVRSPLDFLLFVAIRRCLSRCDL